MSPTLEVEVADPRMERPVRVVVPKPIAETVRAPLPAEKAPVMVEEPRTAKEVEVAFARRVAPVRVEDASTFERFELS